MVYHMHTFKKHMNMKRLIFLFFLSSTLSTTAIAEVAVLATIKPLQLIASAITDGVSSANLLMPVNQSPHHYNLIPSDRVALESSDLIIWIGVEMETVLDSVLQEMSREKPIIELSKQEGMNRLRLRSAHHSDNSATSLPMDPHLWLDTGNALVIAQLIAETLSAMDAGNAENYRQNLQSFTASVHSLNENIEQQLATVRGQVFMVYHDALQYFESQFNWPNSLVLVEDSEMQPGMRHILNTRDAVRELQARCLFTEVSTRPATLQTLLAGFAVPQRKLDLLGVDIAPGAQGYIELMNALTSTMVACFD
jgi:zinc transport system substrate-binding protein